MGGTEGNPMGIGGVQAGTRRSGRAQDIDFDVSFTEVDALLVSNVTGGVNGTSKAVDLKETGGPATGEGTDGWPVRDTVFS
jgi:hypothetical protein